MDFPSVDIRFPKAERRLRNVAASIARIERDGFGRNGDATIRTIEWNLANACEEISQREEAGENVAALARRYWTLADKWAIGVR